MSIDRPPGRRYGKENIYLHYPGCLSVGRQILYGIAIYFIIVGFVFAAFVIGAIVCSLLLYQYY